MFDVLESGFGAISVSPHPVLDASKRDFKRFGNGGLGLSFENPLDSKTAAILPCLGIGNPADENRSRCSTHNQRYGRDTVLSKRIENDLYYRNFFHV
jgi:hypothetical protein